MVIKRDPQTEEFIATLENNHIYIDMRAKFDELTNEGDNYLEEHDEAVMHYASEKYNLSLEEVDQIYTNSEFAISEFHRKRLEKNK